jgi:signal transduction histidine kinase
MPVNNFRLVLEKEDELWFGSRSGGLVRFKEDQIIENYGIGNKLNSNFILALTKDQNGNIYVGTHSGGMTIFYENGTSKSFKIKEDDSGILIFNIDPTNGGNAYVTLNIGPAYFDGDSIKLIKLRKDRISKTYFDIVDDQVGNLWVTTNIGILKIKKQDWFDYLNGKIGEVNYQLIDESNGMNNKECTGATQSTLGSDGKIYFPTLGGVAILNPENFDVEQSNSKVTLRHLYGDNIEYNVNSSNLRMPPGTQRFRFQFALLSFANPKRNQYRYSLIGFDEGWSKPTYSNNVEYTNLPPGNYTFEVIGSQDGTNWENSIASVSFKVLPFFYQTIGFYFLIILAIVGVFLFIYKWRISFIDRQNQKLKKVNEELDRFVYSASHELRSPLSSVLGLVQYAKTEENLKDVQDYLYHIEKSVSRLDGLIGDIIDYSRNARTTISIEPINIYELIYDVADGISFSDYFKKVELNVTDNSTSLLISDPKRLKIILSNIITNAFKHHDPKNIKKPVVNIKIENHNDGLLVIIEDNGPGIDEKFQKDIFKMFYRATVETEGSGLGLYIVKETIEKLKGKIDFSSHPGTGTTFKLYFPNLDIDK